jgi:hypothetical protein
MSFLPDLAGWALSGGAGRGSDTNDDNGNSNNEADGDVPMQQESEEEVRAKRLADFFAKNFICAPPPSSRRSVFQRMKPRLL